MEPESLAWSSLSFQLTLRVSLFSDPFLLAVTSNFMNPSGCRTISEPSALSTMRPWSKPSCRACRYFRIVWQSCTDSGRDHKKKELCGRAPGLRYHWNGKGFVARPGIKKLVLLLDGTWRDEDLKALLRAGWDEIFYPDEMDRLA